jgi:DAHL domain
MKLLSAALGVLLLLALLTWLLLRGIDTNAAAYAVTLRTFDDFALAEASLHRDVLQARAGLLREYDTLVKAVEAMQDAASRLRSHAQTEGLDVAPADRLTATVLQQEELTERFKSSNALLQNSLSYVGLSYRRTHDGGRLLLPFDTGSMMRKLFILSAVVFILVSGATAVAVTTALNP